MNGCAIGSKMECGSEEKGKEMQCGGQIPIRPPDHDYFAHSVHEGAVGRWWYSR